LCRNVTSSFIQGESLLRWRTFRERLFVRTCNTEARDWTQTEISWKNESDNQRLYCLYFLLDHISTIRR